MAESNNSINLLKILAQNAIERQREAIQSHIILIAVHDDQEQIKAFKKIAANDANSISKMYVFDDEDTCVDFVCERVSLNPDVKINVFVGGQLVTGIVSSIHHCQQIQVILITNKPPFNEEERESMKMYSKVKYLADLQTTKEAPNSDRPSNTTSCNSDQLSDVESKEEEGRFIESMALERVYDEGSNENTRVNIVPIERSCKSFDQNFVFRYIMIMCLSDAPLFPSDKDDLIEFFETNNFALPKMIKQFKETYSSSEALRFYTRDPLIYGKLNHALRTTNIDHLVPFRFVFQDICNQLRELMVQERDDQVFTVYRGQMSTPYEVSELYSAYSNQCIVTNATFFSTSKIQDQSMGFLRAAIVNPFAFDSSPVLLKITARKQHASLYFPFADVSKFSLHPEEKEVLFAPGQIFTITSFSIIHENLANIYLFEMNLNNEVDKDITRVYDKFKNMCQLHMNDSLLCLTNLLTTYKRSDEAKQLCLRLISKNDDQNKKYACYQTLLTIAMEQNHTDEANIMYQKMTEIKFGTAQPSADFNDNILISERDSNEIDTAAKQLMNICSNISFDQPLDELLAYAESDEMHNNTNQAMNLQYSLAGILMKNGMYSVAIQFFELLLYIIKANQNILLDPLLKSKCYMQLGQCYRELKLNDQALKNYELALEQNIQLPPNEYIQSLIGFGTTLEATNKDEEALYKYIEVAEIYLNDSTIGGVEERGVIEECIKRVISKLIPID